ncbi:MAG: hypothetical protein C4333_07125 [Meiothermus sp.]
MDHPLVSILTPTYNQSAYLTATLESVLAQSYPHWELLVLDDCSSDDTWEVLQHYARRDPRIRPLRSPYNRGVWRLGENYRQMLHAARGSLVALLDGDDLWPPDKLERQVPAHQASGRPLSFGCMEAINAAGQAIPGSRYPNLGPLALRELYAGYLRGDFYIPAVTVMIEREALERVGGFRQPHYLPVVDFPTWLELGHPGQGYTYVPEVLGYWRQSPGQATWRMARDLALGTYRYSQEFLREHPVPGLSERDLLSPGRRGYLADSSYRAALLAWERGATARAWQYAKEIVHWGRPTTYLRCLAAFGVKTLRRVRRQVLEEVGLWTRGASLR